MTNFKRLNTKIFQKTDSVVTEDTLYWKKFATPVLVKEFGPIDYVHFSPLEPYHFAVTCSVRVQIYNPITKLVTKNLSRFRQNAYGATFRSDGRLICAGGEETNLKLFDVTSKSLLRLFKGHSAAVHRTYFVQDNPQIVSFSDDKTVRIWDIPTETNITTFSEHKDYIRAGAVSPLVPDLILSGGYDNTINMYDLRSNQVTLSVNHGSPVESLLFLPSSGIFISAGGNDIKVWDTSSQHLLGNISAHHKTVTCLALASDNKRLLSGSLDRHVKIYDLSNFRVVHTLDFPNSVLSLGVSKSDDTLVAGLVDGVVSINRRQEDKSDTKVEKKISSFRYRANKDVSAMTFDTYVPDVKLATETKHDKCLRKFQHAKALDFVFLSYVVNKHPETTVSVIQELIKRKVFDKAIHGRDNKFITKLVLFFMKHITNYRFTSVLIDAINIFLDKYGDIICLMPPETVKLILRLTAILDQEVQLCKDLQILRGNIYMLLSSATAVEQAAVIEKKNLQLLPSEDAQKNLIVNLT